MKKRTPDKFWFPWWPDKWIFGSVRIEFTPIERGIWVDLLSLASKDDGHIRANEETPYPTEQLSGMLLIPEDELKNSIEKFIEKGKLTKNKNGTLYVAKWDKYQFSKRHKRRIEEEMSEETDTMSDEEDAILYNKKGDNKIEDNNIYPKVFEEFYKPYPRKIEKKDAFTAWKQLTNKQKDEIIVASKNYAIEMKREGRQLTKIKHPASFLNKDKERWKDYLEITKPYQVGENIHGITHKDIDYMKDRTIKVTEIDKELANEVKKAKKARNVDRLDELENVKKERVAEWSQARQKKIQAI